MPFIKFTETVDHADGQERRFVYVNLDSIVKATYVQADAKLTLLLNIEQSGGKGKESVTITGDEARAAIEILQDA